MGGKTSRPADVSVPLLHYYHGINLEQLCRGYTLYKSETCPEELEDCQALDLYRQFAFAFELFDIISDGHDDDPDFALYCAFLSYRVGYYHRIRSTKCFAAWMQTAKY